MQGSPFTRGTGQAGQGLPLVRLTLALRDAAEFRSRYAGRLEGDGLFVTTLRTRTAGERVRLRIELVSGGTAWTGEVVVTGAGREGGRSGFWVRLPSAADPAPAARPAATPPPLPGRGGMRAAPALPTLPTPPPVPVEEAEEVGPADDETSFAELWSVEEVPAPTPAPLPARATPPPLPARRPTTRPDLSTIFVDDDEDDTLPLPDPGALDALQAPAIAAAADGEEWVEGGIASMELPTDDEALEDLY